MIFDGYEDYHYSDEPYEGDFYRDSYEEYYDDVLPSEWEERSEWGFGRAGPKTLAKYSVL